MKRSAVVILCLAAMGTASAAQQAGDAAEDAVADAGGFDLSPEILAIEGDVAWGQFLSAECKTCHLATGGNEGIPSITAWPEEDFLFAMHAYKRGLRPNPTMQMMAQRLSDEEIAALAAYFAQAR